MVLGLAFDGSEDGASGTITLSTIDSSGVRKPIWTSPTLAPGRTVPVSLTLATPYRFSIQGQSTGSAKAQPAVADPEFLSHLD
jgi:hypothetical protein